MFITGIGNITYNGHTYNNHEMQLKAEEKASKRSLSFF